MNKTITMLKNHATVRNFDTNYKLPCDMLDNIISSAKQAPSWMNGQAYSIMVFTGKEKEKFAKLIQNDPVNGKNFDIIQQSSSFLLFNINLSLYKLDADFSGEIEPLLIGTVDASLALENALVAAESLGLGTCVIGGIRRLSGEIVASFHYPKYSFPLVGIALGKPAQEKFVKPRLPNINVIHAGEEMDFTDDSVVNDYSNTLKSFSLKAGYTSSDWRDRFFHFYNEKKYPKGTKEVLKKQRLI